MRKKLKPVSAGPAVVKSLAVSTVTEAPACNICGGTKFVPGPGGRLSVTKLEPACAGCGAFERHRAFRAIFDKIRSPDFKKLSCLTFGKDRTVAGGWFSSIQYSEPGSKLDLNVQKISMPTESIDVVVCNHLLAGVERYEQGLKELARITSKRGFAFVSFPNPHYRQTTEDWGFPKASQHGHYRVFGADIEPKLPTILPNVGIVRVVAADPVTGAEDRAYIISKSSDFMHQIGEQGLRIRFLHF